MAHPLLSHMQLHCNLQTRKKSNEKIENEKENKTKSDTEEQGEDEKERKKKKTPTVTTIKAKYKLTSPILIYDTKLPLNSKQTIRMWMRRTAAAITNQVKNILLHTRRSFVQRECNKCVCTHSAHTTTRLLLLLWWRQRRRQRLDFHVSSPTVHAVQWKWNTPCSTHRLISRNILNSWSVHRRLALFPSSCRRLFFGLIYFTLAVYTYVGSASASNWQSPSSPSFRRCFKW